MIITEEHNKLQSDNKTNIIYFTSACNLACTYCYEHLKDADKNTMSREDLIKAADNTFAREPDDEQTFFILFGGEASLMWDNIEFFMDYCYSKKKNVQFNMISNGIRFLDDKFTNSYVNNSHYQNGRLALDISFDGLKGNVDRVYHDGKNSTDDMLIILSKLKLIMVQYRLRYTIHQKNIDEFVEDILKINKHFRPQRIILGFVTEQFGTDDNIKLEEGKNKLIKLWNKQELETPICELVCDTCNGCEIQRDNLSLYTDNKEIKRPLLSSGLFSDFKYK